MNSNKIPKQGDVIEVRDYPSLPWIKRKFLCFYNKSLFCLNEDLACKADLWFEWRWPQEEVPKPVESKEEEVFDWKKAMIHYANGKDIQWKSTPYHNWVDVQEYPNISFCPVVQYRLKPKPTEPPEPNWNELERRVEAGEDIKVEVRDNEWESWNYRYFSHKDRDFFRCFNFGPNWSSVGPCKTVGWKYCRLWKEGE